MKPKPRAILDFYGALDFTDDFWHSPCPAMASLPAFEDEFLSRIFQDADPSCTVASLERPPPSSSLVQRIDLSKSRNAWLFNAMREGNHIANVVRDGDYARVDPMTLMSPDFPPTAFIHGTADTLVDYRFSRDAHRRLKDLGVESELISVEGRDHGFDAAIEEGAEDWEKIEAGLEFLARHV